MILFFNQQTRPKSSTGTQGESFFVAQTGV
jgi:hypothetical protein